MLFEYLATAAMALGSAALAALLYSIVKSGDGGAERLRARIGELLAEKEALEKKLLELQGELGEARKRCEEEKRGLREMYEKRLEEALNENRAALALYEAVKAGLVGTEAEGCQEVLVQLDGQVLCKKTGLELEVLWPREQR